MRRSTGAHTTAKITTEGWPVQILPFKSSKNFPLSLSGHVVPVFTDDDGREYVINAGPSEESYPWGQLDLRQIGAPLTKRFNVVDGSQVNAAWRGSTKVDLAGRDAEEIWNILVQHARSIHRAVVDYHPVARNSNTVIGALLDVVGIDIQAFLPDPRGVMLGGYIGATGRLNFDYSLTGSDSDDFPRRRGGSQTFEGRGGADTLIGGKGADRLFGNAAQDLLLGGRDNDVLGGGSGDDQLIGDRGNDRMYGGPGSDHLIGNAGNDMVNGGPGNDIVRGSQGNDNLSGGDGDDRLTGAAGNDILRGGPGNDVIRGGEGNDLLVGDDGNDRLVAGDGNDVLQGGPGRDELFGEAGADTFEFKTAADSGLGNAADRVKDFQTGVDLIDIEDVAADLAFAEGGLTSTGPSFTLVEAGGDTEVQVDVDGDGVADMRIVVENATGLGEDDFIL